MREQARKKLFFALDVDDMQKAARWVERLKGRIGGFKVGKQLFTACGPEVVKMIRAAGSEVFLDLKYHDIPNTVAGASLEAARLQVKMFNVHALGGREMMTAAVSALRGYDGGARPLLLAVTVLTSMHAEALHEVGMELEPGVLVPHLARLAQDCGVDGVVASPREIESIRRVCGPDFLIVTPGVRLANAGADDQKRVATPAEAVRAGADFLVVGRPIAQASDPESAAEAIVEEMARALAGC
ncbi:MAG: orotidine-5'-phosphate decarboxylase [Deltaproteobacteria bacterium]|nr:orotidine-5'-phosphate decarboxylase [Deltaproteobacteria bacterium]